MVFYVVNGVVSGDLLGVLLFAIFATLGADRIFGVDACLLDTDLVDRYPTRR